MTEQLFRLPKDGTGTLQKQIQEMLVKAILDGHIPPEEPLPSGRKLAEQLNVARNTVVFAYQQLVDEGFLISRERRGHFINREILEGRIDAPQKTSTPATSDAAVRWNRLVMHPAEYKSNAKPEDWQSYPYPFLYGQYDKSLFPVADWRECCKEAASLSSIYDWAADHVDHDNPDLLEQIHTRLLPRRGIWADPEEILITVGAQNAIYLAASLLLDNSRTIGIENPGYYDGFNSFQSITPRIQTLAVDDQGLMISPELDNCDCIYTTPSHHFPTNVSMSIERREALLEFAEKRNIILIEDDYESEFNFVGKPSAALKSMDRDGRVIYISSLSKTLAPGIRLGYIVAQKEFIRQARALRRLVLRHPPSNNQSIIAHFLKRGYHDSAIRRLSLTLKERWKIMAVSLDKYMPGSTTRPTFGGSAFWIRGPNALNAGILAEEAKKEGVLIEPGVVFYYGKNAPENYYRLAFSSISSDRIEEGVRILARLQERLVAERSNTGP